MISFFVDLICLVLSASNLFGFCSWRCELNTGIMGAGLLLCALNNFSCLILCGSCWVILSYGRLMTELHTAIAIPTPPSRRNRTQDRKILGGLPYHCVMCS
ncbi:hypothetical protein HS088_TW22G00425 [Tripterygium wilfordii]|uniref:Uncharacterized protein n=1 Tax=Tripterygium wilfordii TaxID=458696 RepID=A0A7J7BXY7_TRIWF|nr:hypothetical protein HS088_TW22G00425 [Tripterygium wilfordii]